MTIFKPVSKQLFRQNTCASLIHIEFSKAFDLEILLENLVNYEYKFFFVNYQFIIKIY